MNNNVPCKNCINYQNDSQGIAEKARSGNFCKKYNWNLDRVKTWTQKYSTIRQVITYPNMKVIPNCFSRKGGNDAL